MWNVNIKEKRKTAVWSLYFRRLLKDEEVPEFQALLISLDGISINTFLNKRVWSLEPGGSFTVKSLVNHLSTSPIDITLQRSLWKTKSPKRVNMSVWIMLHGSLNCASYCKKGPHSIIFHPTCALSILITRKTFSTSSLTALMLQIAGSGCSKFLIYVGLQMTT